MGYTKEECMNYRFDKGKLSGSARSSCLHGRRNQSRRIIRFRWELSWRLRNELWTGPCQSDLHVAKHLPHTRRSLRDIVVIYFTTWCEICSSRNIIEKLHLSTENTFSLLTKFYPGFAHTFWRTAAFEKRDSRYWKYSNSYIVCLNARYGGIATLLVR